MLLSGYGIPVLQLYSMYSSDVYVAKSVLTH